MLPESSKKIKTFSKRDVVNATDEQKEKLGKAKRRRAIVAESTSSSENEETKTKKQTRDENVRTPELAFDYEEEALPSTKIVK